MEDYYAIQSLKGLVAPAKKFSMDLAALIIKERLQVTDEEFIEQIKANPYL